MTQARSNTTQTSLPLAFIPILHPIPSSSLSPLSRSSLPSPPLPFHTSPPTPSLASPPPLYLSSLPRPLILPHSYVPIFPTSHPSPQPHSSSPTGYTSLSPSPLFFCGHSLFYDFVVHRMKSSVCITRWTRPAGSRRPLQTFARTRCGVKCACEWCQACLLVVSIVCARVQASVLAVFCVKCGVRCECVVPRARVNSVTHACEWCLGGVTLVGSDRSPPQLADVTPDPLLTCE